MPELAELDELTPELEPEDEPVLDEELDEPVLEDEVVPDVEEEPVEAVATPHFTSIDRVF